MASGAVPQLARKQASGSLFKSQRRVVAACERRGRGPRDRNGEEDGLSRRLLFGASPVLYSHVGFDSGDIFHLGTTGTSECCSVGRLSRTACACRVYARVYIFSRPFVVHQGGTEPHSRHPRERSPGSSLTTLLCCAEWFRYADRKKGITAAP